MSRKGLEGLQGETTVRYCAPQWDTNTAHVHCGRTGIALGITFRFSAP